MGQDRLENEPTESTGLPPAEPQRAPIPDLLGMDEPTLGDMEVDGDFECGDPADAAAADALGQTVAFEVTAISQNESDGFPDVDDLSDRVLAQYRLGPLIGRGTMGRVYRAEHLGLKRTCAVKVMNPSLVDREPDTLEQFWAEARAVAGLVHPHIVTVHNLGLDRGYHFIEMELVEHRSPYWREVEAGQGCYDREYVPGGVSLKEKIVHNGPMTALQATAMIRQVSLALEAAHASGLVHRDVKPANVLLTADGHAKLADFGLVRHTADSKGHGKLAGTPTFMAPELFLGAPPTPGTDLYALGVSYYYLLTGRLPFASDRIARLVQRKMFSRPKPLQSLVPDLPEDVLHVVDRLLAPRPDDRYDSADSLSQELRRVLGTLRDTASLVEEAVEGLGGLLQHTEADRFRVVLPVPGDRLQEVYIEGLTGRDRERLLSVFSLCGPATPSYFEEALKLNAELTHGSVSIHRLGSEPMFVMTKTFSRSYVTPEEIRSAVIEISRQADRIELRLTQTDIY